ncbi:MAG: protein kinase [Acidobacteriota bacterium]
MTESESTAPRRPGRPDRDNAERGPESASDAERPRTVGPFQLGESLGSGAMGEVYLAQDERLGRWVALKRIQPGHHSRESRTRFRREAKAVAKLRHRSIVQIHDLLETEDGDWLVMERLEGESLAHRLEGAPLDPLKAVGLAKRIAEGLAEAHAHGVVHRDLKPSNIMLTATGVKILDFGLAKTESRDRDDSGATAEGQLIGTIGAMAPEQAMGLEIDERADLFALGMLLYQMLTGVAPFKRRTALATLNAICDATPAAVSEAAPDVPADLQRLVHELLEKRPDDRPESAQVVVDRLRRARAELGGSSASYSSAAPIAAPAHRGMGLLAWAAGLAIAGAVGLSILFSIRPAAPAPPDDTPLKLLVSPFFYSGLESHRFFAQGLGEEIRVRLSALDDVMVISRLAAEAGADEYARPSADFRLDGTVAWPGDGRPVTVNLRLTADGERLPTWEQTFEELPDEVLALQAKLAGDVAQQLPIRVGEIDRLSMQRQGTDSQPAYLAYLEGLDWEQRSRFALEHLDRALLAYRQAVDEDSGFVDARARAIRFETFDYLNRSRSPEKAQEIRRQLLLLQQLAPDDVATRLAAAEVTYRVEGDLDRAYAELAAVLAAEPNHAEALATLGYLQRRRGHLREAVRALEKAAELSPLDAALPGFIAETYRAERDLDAAWLWYQRSLQLAPGDGWIRGQAALVRFELDGCGDPACGGDRGAGALALLDQAPEPDDEAIQLHRFWLDAGLSHGDPERLAAAYARLPSPFKEPAYALISFPSRAAVLQRLGRTSELRQLAARQRTRLRQDILLDPEYPANHCFLSISVALDPAPDALDRARRHADTCIELARADRFSGPRARERWAMALTLSGHHAEAADLIEPLLGESYQRALTRRGLRHDPMWAPVAAHLSGRAPAPP